MKTRWLWVLGAVLAACGQPTATVTPPDASSPSDDAATQAVARRAPSPLRRAAGAPLQAPPDTRSALQIAQAACTAADSSLPVDKRWRCGATVPRPTAVAAASGASTPIIPPSWGVPVWVVDGLNTSGTASDANDCTSTATACLTWNEINVHRWGCGGSPAGCPRLRQNTSVEFLSANAATDVAYWLPAIENGAIPQIFCPLGAAQQVCTGTITVTQAKVRTLGGSHKLAATTCAGAAINEFAVNTTHPSAAWVEGNVSGNTWNFSQPYTRVTPPWNGADPPEVDTWTTGDTVTIYSEVTATVAAVEPLTIGYPVSGVTGPYVYNCNVVPVSSIFVISPPAVGLESLFSSPITINGTETSTSVNFINSVSLTDLIGSTSTSYLAAPGWQGGIIRQGFAAGSSVSLIGGVIADGPITANNIQVDDLYIASGKTVTLQGFGIGLTHTGQAGNFIWGPGTFVVQQPGSFFFNQNTVTTAMLASAFQIDGLGTACATSNVTPAVTNCNITITGAHMDAPFGVAGFGGIAWTPAGGSYVDLSSPF